MTPPAGASSQRARLPRVRPAAPRSPTLSDPRGPRPPQPPPFRRSAAAAPGNLVTCVQAAEQFRWRFSLSEDKGNKEATSPAVIIWQQIEQEYSEYCREDNPSNLR